VSKDQIEEFGKCFEELEAPLIAYAYQILREREDARDQVQEAFKRMILQEETIEQPKAWLYRTVRNLCISHLRKHQRMQKEGEEKQLDFFAGKLDTSDDNNTPIEKLERTEKINRVLHFISLLPEDARTLIKMKFEEKLCYREISQKTGLTEGNVGYKLHHLLRSLAEELKSEGIIA
jgi:RNA polymerase sigma-70 factor (ECF subfamily)